MADQPTEAIKPESEADAGRPKAPSAALAAALLVTLLFCFAHALIAPLQDAEGRFVDYRLRNGRLTAPNTNLVYLAVDRVTYAGEFLPADQYTNATPEDQYFMRLLHEEFPWNRRLFAATVDKLADLGARKILLNFTFATQKPDDPEFKAVLNRHAAKVIIGASFHLGESMLQLGYPSPTLIQPDEFGEVLHDQRIGFVNTHADKDGVTRRALYDLSMAQLIRDNFADGPALEIPRDVTFESLTSRVMRSLGRGDELPPPSTHPLLRYTGPRHTFETISLGTLFDPIQRKDKFERTGFFKDKIVIIGPGQAVLEEQHQTPFRVDDPSMDGSELHLNYLNAALQHELVRETDRTGNLLLILAAGVVLLLLTAIVHNPLLRILAACLVAGIWLVISFWLYNQHNLMAGAVITPMLLLVSGSMITGLIRTRRSLDLPG